VYADDLVACVNHQHLEQFIKTLYRLSDEYVLFINSKKFAIFAVRNHCQIEEDAELRGIPILTEYCYLGVTIDHVGSIEPHLERMQKRSNYMLENMHYHLKDLSFFNNYLLFVAGLYRA
jgi:hypothetical protein